MLLLGGGYCRYFPLQFTHLLLYACACCGFRKIISCTNSVRSYPTALRWCRGYILFWVPSHVYISLSKDADVNEHKIIQHYK